MSQQAGPGLTTDIPMKFRVRNGKAVMVLPDGSRAIERKDAIVDNTMVKVIARGHRWHRMLCDGVYNTIEDLAATEKINASYVGRVLRLTLLAPEIIEAILEGRQPVGMTMAGLLMPFPLMWAEQRAALGA